VCSCVACARCEYLLFWHIVLVRIFVGVLVYYSLSDVLETGLFCGRLGDMAFSLGTWFLPLECSAENRNAAGGQSFITNLDCMNAEKNDPDLVVTKLILSINRRKYTESPHIYQACNVCVDGKDPVGTSLHMTTVRSCGKLGNTFVIQSMSW